MLFLRRDRGALCRESAAYLFAERCICISIAAIRITRAKVRARTLSKFGYCFLSLGHVGYTFRIGR